MSLEDIDLLPESPSEGDAGHIEDHGRIARGLKTLKAQPKLMIEDLFDPVEGVLPTSEIATDQYTTDAPTGYTSMTGTIWSSPKLNTQGMTLVAVNSSVEAAGCTNKPTTRTVGALVDVEFILDGDKFAVHMQSFGYADTQIYVEHNGKMRKLKDTPMSITQDGFLFRDVKFTSRKRRRIRVLVPFIFFVQIIHEGNAVLRKSPDRPLMVTTGDSYVDGSSSYNPGSSKTFQTFGINEALLERTGFAIARHGQGGSGYFNNGAGVATETAGPANTTRFFSTERVNSIKAIGLGKIDFLLVNGTINDGELSGGKAGMKARVLAGLQSISSWDPNIKIILVGPENLNDPPVNGVHDLNRQALIEVAAEHPQCIAFLDVSKPGAGWWAGVGTELSPNIYDSQSKLVGYDGIHGNWNLYDLYGGNIIDEIKDIPIDWSDMNG